jgi:hypothetical protein
MRRDNAGSLVVVASLLVLAAICGYLLGQGRHRGPALEAVRNASNASAALEYPRGAGWRPASRTPTIAGLSFSQPLVLAPGGDPTSAALVAGDLANPGWLPLPAAFLAQARGWPKTEIVGLENTEAYKYSGVEKAAGGKAFTIYTIPSSSARQATVLCYAPPADAAAMATCEEIAATFIASYPTGEVPIADLIPTASYAHEVSALLARVEQLRAALREGIGGLAAQATVAQLSLRLAGGIAGATTALSQVKPPVAAEQVHAALLSALSSTRQAYSALAAAASAGSQADYATARGRISAAEANLDNVLGAFSLLGYG